MVRLFSEEKREEIIRLQKLGFNDKEIAKKVGVSYGGVRYYRKNIDPYFIDFIEIIQKVRNGENVKPAPNNIYVHLLGILPESGKKYEQIERKVQKVKKLRGKLQRLREEGLIFCEKKKWYLTNKGKELCKYLFSS